MNTLVSAFHQAASISRATLYEREHDLQLPLNLQSDARVPILGFCGPRYVVGNPVLLAINPGGGGDDYRERHARDEELIPLIEAFVRASQSAQGAAFEKMSLAYMQHVQNWNLKNILEPTLDACGKNIDEVCFLNLFPYRTRMNRRPSAKALNSAWIKVIAPLLSELRPMLLIALGRKAGSIAEKFPQPTSILFAVQRTNGDRYLCKQAETMLVSICDAARKLYE